MVVQTPVGGSLFDRSGACLSRRMEKQQHPNGIRQSGGLGAAQVSLDLRSVILRSDADRSVRNVVGLVVDDDGGPVVLAVHQIDESFENCSVVIDPADERLLPMLTNGGPPDDVGRQGRPNAAQYDIEIWDDSLRRALSGDQRLE